MKNSKIYFDIAATTPIDVDVAHLIHKVNLESYGNASSIHSIGQKSHNILERSRITISNILNCKSSEIFFTSGGSESNNLVLKGILNAGDHFITSSYEHPSILALAKDLLKEDIEVSFIKPNKFGLIDPEKIKKAIQENTKLISIMYVNNEIGTTNDIEKMSAIATEHNIPFHSDAVQYIGKERIDLSNNNINFLSIGAHKFYGPKGIGILYCKAGNSLKPLISGGGQENGLRAGTENVSFIAGMSLALEIANNNYSQNKNHILELENHFFKSLDQTKINYRLNGVERLPGILNITFPNMLGQTLVMKLDLHGIAVSFGSACSSGTPKPSEVLLNLGLNEDQALKTIRISIGKFHTKNDIHELVNILQEVLCNKYEKDPV